MTTKAEPPKLFNFDPNTTRIVGYGIGAQLALDPDNSCNPPVLIKTVLADPKTKKETNKELFLALSPPDAIDLAKLILAHAARCGWKEPEGGVAVQLDPIPKKKLN